MVNIAAIVPAYNEEGTIAKSLNSLLYSLPHKDIYVISDGSKDNTAESALEYTQNVLNEKTNRGKMGAIKFLLEYYRILERYDYVFFMDADTLVSHDFIESANQYLEAKFACVVGQVVSRDHNMLTFYRKIEYYIAHEVYKKSQSFLGAITVAPGCCSIFSTHSLKQMDYENPTLAEDLNLTIQIYRRKLGKIVYCHSAKVYTQDPDNLKDFYNQINRWFSGWFQCLKKYHVPFGFTRFDFEALYLISEGVIYGAITLMIPYFLIKFPYYTSIGLLADFSFFFLFAFYICWRNNTIKFVPFIPFYYVLKMIQNIIYLKCLFFNRSNLWRKVGRY